MLNSKPTTVTLLAPVVAPFVMTNPLVVVLAESKVMKGPSSVDTLVGTVTATLCVDAESPDADRARVLESDAHVVASVLLCTRPPTLPSPLPKFDPTTVTLDAAVVATFVPTALLTPTPDGPV